MQVTLFQKEMRDLAISRESKARDAAAAKEATRKLVGFKLMTTAAGAGVDSALPALLTPRALAPSAGARRRGPPAPPATAPAPKMRVERLPPLQKPRAKSAGGKRGIKRGGSKDGSAAGKEGTGGAKRSVWSASTACTKVPSQLTHPPTHPLT